MKRCTLWFNNLSLYKKILTIFLLALLAVCITFLISIRILTSRYNEELYRTNANSLNHVTTFLESEMQVIQSLSDNMIGDPIFQDNLVFLADNPYSNRRALARRDIYQQLYSYVYRSKYIKSINIILADGTNICMGSSDEILKFNVNELDEITSSLKGKATWAPAMEPGDDTVCARQILKLKYLSLKKLAGLYITVNMERMIEDGLKSAGSLEENSNFILMSGEKRIYPATAFHDAYCAEIIAGNKQQENAYLISTLDNKKEFIISGHVPYVDWNYIYFRDYDPLFYRIQLISFQILFFTFFIIFINAACVNLIFRHIFRHLDYLIEKIQKFGSGESPACNVKCYDYENRQDEIGQLHRSFDDMTHSVKVLRDENYDKQLLLRDSTIKMLQQQINPHFLYNTLDTINWMAQKYGADDISVMVRSLGNLFRASIAGQKDIIPLEDELEVLDNYIRIQEIRFKDRLHFELKIPEKIFHIFVPKLCIQPLVENALKHAMEDTDEMCMIQVVIEEMEKDYEIRVSNTGSRFESDLLEKIRNKEITPQGSGVGLTNIHSRLKLLYGDHYGLKFYNEREMAVVMLSIPKGEEI
ncbi:sensor histidine kinase [Clostridium sp. WB02_MRS01]|uniref:sensor histidine kinase n=1 Tax=Clostridium sp. WB02_MRS01 TaxID=2605777 RepID=UPI0012B19086|nr:sensor histidine kinase [Clostridium sp. WB02_MRS01]MSS09852.1 sensor histidine kinase [Clostridium sp. WB02_MRS01]